MSWLNKNIKYKSKKHVFEINTCFFFDDKNTNIPIYSLIYKVCYPLYDNNLQSFLMPLLPEY